MRRRRESGEAGEEAGRTRLLPAVESGREPRDILRAVCAALAERGYDPVHQLAGYLLSGDPAFITAHRGARSLVQRLGREELMEELVRDFLVRRGAGA